MRAGKGRLRFLLLCAVLELGALAGVPMRPDEIEKLMQTLARPKLAQTLPNENEKGDGGREPTPGGS
jgi:hypothetical protein